jgi:hypothetical protein
MNSAREIGECQVRSTKMSGTMENELCGGMSRGGREKR